MPKHAAGVGIAGKHTTIIDAAEPVIRALVKIQGTRVTLGIIKKLRGNGHRKIKFTDTISGFKLKITGNCFVQEFHVITSADQRKAVIKAVHKAFNHE